MKRAQAAMEFLMTYGWALLVVLVAIGALAFFGVLNPSKFLPNSCSLAPGFACTDFKASASGNTVTIVLQNGLGDTLNSVSLYLNSANPGCSAPSGLFTPSTITMQDGGTTTLTLTCAGTTLTGKSGSKLKGDLVISYYTQSGGQLHQKIGQLVTGIEQ